MTKISVDRYIVDALLPDLVGHDRAPSAFVVYLFLWARTWGAEARSVSISHRMLADATGLSKSAVQAAIRLLVRRKLVRAHLVHRTAVPEYIVLRPWVRSRAGS